MAISEERLDTKYPIWRRGTGFFTEAINSEANKNTPEKNHHGRRNDQRPASRSTARARGEAAPQEGVHAA